MNTNDRPPRVIPRPEWERATLTTGRVLQQHSAQLCELTLRTAPTSGTEIARHFLAPEYLVMIAETCRSLATAIHHIRYQAMHPVDAPRPTAHIVHLVTLDHTARQLAERAEHLLGLRRQEEATGRDR